LHPTIGSNIASIGNDLKCKLWTEEPSQPPNSGRRFRCLHTISSNTKVPFVSLDIKKLDFVSTYIALIDRSGLLSIYEPANLDSFKEWSLLDQWNVCSPNPPDRGAETSFKVRFDQNPVSTPYMNSLTEDFNMLSLVATAMDTVKIYRSTATPINFSSTPGVMAPTGHKTIFYEAARFPTHPALIRDVQWAPFNVRGFDLFATACRDGGVRIYRLDTTACTTNPNTSPSEPSSQTTSSTNHPSSPAAATLPRRPGPQSSLTSAIVGRSGPSALNPPQSTTPSHPTITTRQHSRSTIPSPFTHTLTTEAELPDAHRDAWALCWDPAGQVLMSSGSDGVTKLWKKAVMGAGWLLFADQEISVDDSDGEEGGEGEKADG
jgi:nucleoporin SEH1